MAFVLPADLDPAASVIADAALIVQNGATVDKATPLQIMDAARPLASQADAETGADNAKVMSALRVNQAIVQQVPALPFADPVAPAYLKTISDIISGLPVSIMRFVPASKILGIVARSNGDDLHGYFADALASGLRELILPPGLYNTDSTIEMENANQKLVGAGWTASEIKVRSTSASAVTLADGVAGYGLKGLRITRDGTAAVGADGIRCLGTTDDTTLEDMWIEGHSTGLTIGTCDTGHIKRLRSTRNLLSGVFQTNAISYGPSQWDVDDVLCDRNALDGWRVVANAGPAGLIMGQMRNLRSFANSGWGLNLLGNATTGIYDLRLSDAFMGSDGGGSVHFDTHGGKHRISGFFERNGRDPTGPNLGTAASNTAPGIWVENTNTDVTVYGSIIDDNSLDGILHDGGVLVVGVTQIYNNGQALTSGRRNGILSQGGRLIAGVSTSNNRGANTTQLYGIAASHDDVIIGANDLAGNTTAATTLGGTADAVLIGNAGTPIHRLPTALNVGDATGATLAGDINAATDIKKNGTAFTNP